MEDILNEFVQKYNIDERAWRALASCTSEVQLKVLSTFQPKEQSDTQDYSRKLMGYIRSMTDAGPGGGHKRSRNEMEELLDLNALNEPVTVGDEADLLHFRLRFPMDDRAFEFLSTSPVVVQARVMRDFNPRSSTDADYSSLVTSFVRMVRAEMEGQGSVASGGGGPTLQQLEDFKARYPMDSRAWEFLTSSPGHTQTKVLTEFKPRNEADTDYSAAVTAFLRAIGSRGLSGGSFGGGCSAGFASRAPPRSMLDAFRARFPMDDRAFEFLSNSSAAVQQDVLQHFAPRNISDSDYSRPITSYLKQVRERFERFEGPLSGAMRSSFGGASGGASGGGSSGACGWLRAFRTCFPMDDRAFEFLEMCPLEVQEAVVSEFNPKRAGDTDYSPAVTSFVRRVRDRLGAGPAGVRLVERRSVAPPMNLLKAFKMRYPMDDRAWDFLSSSSGTVQRMVLEKFKPKREGEHDYSRLITSFIRAQRD